MVRDIQFFVDSELGGSCRTIARNSDEEFYASKGPEEPDTERYNVAVNPTLAQTKLRNRRQQSVRLDQAGFDFAASHISPQNIMHRSIRCITGISDLTQNDAGDGTVGRSILYDLPPMRVPGLR